MKLTAYAKINLYLKVVGKLPDAYHEIETLFERISLCDNILIEPAGDETSITCSDPKIPTDKNSLIGRTVDAFKKRAGIKDNFFIELDKNIPVGAGLGGGSSDSASVLRGINEISGKPLKIEELTDIGGTLGADVPFFLYDCSFGYGRGRGDIISRLNVNAKLWHILVNPPFEISTKEVYGKVSDFALTKEKGVDKMFTTFLNRKDINSLGRNLQNDLQVIVLEKYPEMNSIFIELKEAGAKGVLLSGSGSTVFGIFDENRVAKAEKKIREVFPGEKNWNVFSSYTY